MNEVPQITQAEIDKYKNVFDEKIGHYAVSYDKNEEGEESMGIYQGDSGIDANWSGSIILEQDYSVKWNFSILNGASIDAKMKLNDENKNLISNVYDIYEIWRDGLKQYLVGGGEEASAGGFEDAGEEIVSGGPAETSPAGEEMPLAESKTIKGRQGLINESSDRMKRLAGLK